MKYVWFKSYDGNNLEDLGLIEAESESDVYSKLYDSREYSSVSESVTAMPLTDLLEKLKFAPYGVLSLMDEYMEM